MSSYSNFIQDFPSRCLDILKKYEKDAITHNREVTLMLAIATAGFVIPFERLRPLYSEDSDHPSRDREKFSKARNKLERILDVLFVDSALWNKKDVGSWIFAKELRDVEREPDFWPELKSPKSLSIKKQVSSILKHLRNGLAHGNIYTKGDPIRLIIFLSRCCKYVDKKCIPTDKYDMLAVSPADFCRFLINWLNFLANLPILTTIMQESVMELLEYPP